MLTIADLIVKIRADVTGVQSGMLKTSAAVKGIEADAEAAGGKWTRFSSVMSKGWMVSAGILAVGGIAIKKGISDLDQYGDTVLKIHRLTGMAAQESSLFAAQLVGSGVGAEAAGTSMKFFEKNMFAARTEGSAQAKMFADLGVKMKDAQGNWRDTGSVLNETRDKMAALDDATKKTDYMVAMFGRGGAAMAPWLAKSRAELDQMTNAAKKLGLVWDDKKLEQYHKFALAQHALGLEIKGVGVQMGVSMMPVLEKMTKVLQIVVGIFTKIPGPIKALAITAVIAAAALSVTMKAATFLASGFRTLTGATVKQTAAEATQTKVTVENSLAQNENQLSLFKDTGAREANTIAAKEGTLAGGRFSAMLKSQALQWMAVAAAAIWTYGKVTQAYHAWQQMNQAQNIMMSNMEGLQSTINANAGRLGKEGYSQAQQALIMGNAGSTTAGLQAIQAMGKGGSVGVPGTTINVNVGSVLGTDSKAADQFANMVGNRVMGRVMAAQGGGRA